MSAGSAASSRAGFEPAVRALAQRLADTPWPGPPQGFVHVAPPRAMRVVLAGSLAAPGGGVPVVVKWHRAVTWRDRIARRFTGGRGPREARLLAALRARGLPVPEPLGSADEPADLLVTRRIEGLGPLPAASAAPRALVEEVARLLAGLHAAGLVHRDLTSANVGVGTWAGRGSRAGPRAAARSRTSPRPRTGSSTARRGPCVRAACARG
jgi:hypothetical protein